MSRMMRVRAVSAAAGSGAALCRENAAASAQCAQKGRHSTLKPQSRPKRCKHLQPWTRVNIRTDRLTNRQA